MDGMGMGQGSLYINTIDSKFADIEAEQKASAPLKAQAFTQFSSLILLVMFCCKETSLKTTLLV